MGCSGDCQSPPSGAAADVTSDVGPEERRDPGLTVDPHRDPAGGGERRGRLDGGPKPAVEVGDGTEAGDSDPGAGGLLRGELVKGVRGPQVALVGGELE